MASPPQKPHQIYLCGLLCFFSEAVTSGRFEDINLSPFVTSNQFVTSFCFRPTSATAFLRCAWHREPACMRGAESQGRALAMPTAAGLGRAGRCGGIFPARVNAAPTPPQPHGNGFRSKAAARSGSQTQKTPIAAETARGKRSTSPAPWSGAKAASDNARSR